MRKATLAGCLALALLALAPAAARACPSFAGVKGFEGKIVEASYQQTASGEDPGAGGLETVSLVRDATAFKVRLKAIERAPRLTTFAGKLKGGYEKVEDHFVNTGEDLAGVLHAAQQLPIADSAVLMLDPQGCRYQFSEETATTTTFSGDDGIEPPGTVTEVAWSPQRPIPRSLRLDGSAMVDATKDECPGHGLRHDKDGCYAFEGGWASDFDILAHCGSVTSEQCSPESEPVGKANFVWKLRPILAKP